MGLPPRGPLPHLASEGARCANNGTLSFSVNEAMKYWNENEYVLERHQTEEAIFLRVVRVNPDHGS